MMYDLIIKNGFVVFPDCVEKTDIGIKDGIIVHVGKHCGYKQSQRTFDASGKYIFPGGIDVHVHMSDLGAPGLEDWGHGSYAAAKGGLTTIVDMPIDCVPATTTLDAMKKKLEHIQHRSYVDYMLWGGLTDNNYEELLLMIQNGCVGLKTFLTDVGREDMKRPSYAALLRAMRFAAENEIPLMVHAEDQDTNAYYEKKYKGAADWKMWSKIHPAESEIKAVTTCINLAELTGARVHIAHVSSAEVVRLIQKAKLRGVKMTCETCPHYLLFSEDDYGEKGALLKCTPPVRDENNRKEMWKCIQEGYIDMISSDHSPSDTKTIDDSVCEAWAGVSGLQVNLETLYSEGYVKRNIGLPEIAALYAGNAAALLGISKRKGSIEVNKDADLVILDPDKEVILSEKMLETKVRQSVYCNTVYQGSIVKTYLRGREINYGETRGEYLRRGLL